MGIRFHCPNGHKLNVKAFLAGKRGICPHCGVSFLIPTESTRPASKKHRQGKPREDDSDPEIAAVPPQPAAPMGGSPAGFAGPSPLYPARDVTVPGETKPRGPAFSTPGQQPASVGPSFPSQPSFPAPAGTPSGFGPVVSSPTALDVGAMGAPANPSMVGPSNSTMATSVRAAANGPFVPRSSAAAPAASPPGAPGQAADPLAENPNMVWYVRPASGGQYGPATAELMRSWLAEGRIGPDTLVWREGWRDWQEASGVFPQFRVAEVVPGVTAAKGVPRGTGPANRTETGPGRSNGILPILVAGLFLVVILLLIIFVWLLFHQSGGSEEASATGIALLSQRSIRFVVPASAGAPAA